MSRPLPSKYLITAGQLSRLLQSCGVDDSSFARLAGASREQVKAWRKGKYPIPKYIGALAVLIQRDGISSETDEAARMLKELGE